ncbi:MAG: hypothetical protein IPH45_07940 [Bacteroidales bacterium]|nr:hypothetical protein [Bacteroidales bacterium]
MKLYSCPLQTYLILFFIFLFKLLPAQENTPDSCLSLVFHSTLEQQGFDALCSGKSVDYLTMAIAVNPSSDKATLENFKGVILAETSAIKKFMEKQKKLSKSLKFIFDDVQQKFLKAYDLDAEFNDLFESGKYNCLTATILYSVILENLGIDHKIKFMPGHVYLVAFNGEIPFMFETTDPYAGFYEITDAEQTKALQGMRLLQFMASGNGQDKSGSDLFDRYFIKLNNTEMRGLVGYQYVNQAVTEMMNSRFTNVYDLTSKAILLTPMAELRLLREESLRQAIALENKNTVKRAKLLATYYNTTSNVNKKNQVADEFKLTIYQCLFSAFPAPDSMKPIYETLKNSINDADMVMVLSDLYSSTYSEYLKTTENYEEYVEFIFRMYGEGVKSNFIKMQIQTFVDVMGNSLPYQENGIEEYDSIALKYPVLDEFEDFRRIQCHLWVSNAENAFRNNQIAEGEAFLKKYEENSFAGAKNCNASIAYSVAASYFFRKGNTTKSKALLKKGLSYDPNNWELKQKLREISK